MLIHYSTGNNAKDTKPTQKIAKNWPDYIKQIRTLAKTGAKKPNLPYIWGAMRDPNGKRNFENAGGRSVLYLDIDGCAKTTWDDFSALLETYQCFAYTTASHTPECPRWRVGIMLSREVKAEEYQRLGMYVEQDMMSNFELLGDGEIKWDKSVYNPAQMVFAPQQEAEFIEYSGEPLSVEAFDLAFDLTAPIKEKKDIILHEPIDAHIESDLRSALWHPEVLKLATPGVGLYSEWIAMGCRLASFIGTEFEDNAREIWLEWSMAAGGSADDIQVAEGRWDGGYLTPDRTGYAAIFTLAQSKGWTNPAAERLRANSVATLDDFEKYPPSTLPKFTRNKNGKIPATLIEIEKALNSPAFLGVKLGYDTFRDEVMIANVGTDAWRSFEDEDYIDLRIDLEKKSFKPISRELIKDAVSTHVRNYKFDSAQIWINSLEWDGIPRIEKFYYTHFGAQDNEYTRAVSLYTWSALAGRILKPGAKADMVPILVSNQGKIKSTGIAALSPALDFFTEINLADKDDDLARKMRGCLLAEISELRGLNTKDLESIKAFVTRTHERWIPKFKEKPVTYPRRCICIGTANEDEFLGDTTGNRRWLPVDIVRKIDIARIEADRDQLWAEARELYKEKGICWLEAEERAKTVHSKFAIVDPWSEIIETYLFDNEDLAGKNEITNIQSTHLLRNAIGLDPKHITRREYLRVAKIMRTLGYQSTIIKQNGRVVRAYRKKDEENNSN